MTPQFSYTDPFGRIHLVEINQFLGTVKADVAHDNAAHMFVICTIVDTIADQTAIGKELGCEIADLKPSAEFFAAAKRDSAIVHAGPEFGRCAL